MPALAAATGEIFAKGPVAGTRIERKPLKQFVFGYKARRGRMSARGMLGRNGMGVMGGAAGRGPSGDE